MASSSSSSDRRTSNSQLLQELDALSQTLYPARRTSSFALPRTSTNPNAPPVAISPQPPSRPRRMSMSPFRSRPSSTPTTAPVPTADTNQISLPDTNNKSSKLWGWKPLRALSHIGMNRLGCLFSVEAVSVANLPASMNGLRLCVTVRKKETKDGAVQTMPARVLNCAADLEETLFIRCHVYCSSGKPIKFEPRPFLVYVSAVDAPELDFGRSIVDLSALVKESVERNSEGTRIRQWDVAFPLTGKAKGGELVVKLGFQIMEDGGVGIYSQSDGRSSSKDKSLGSASPLARGQSKSSFSVPSPRVTRPDPPVTPSVSAADLKGLDDFKLDEPEEKAEELEEPDFEVIDRGVEVEENKKEDEKENEKEDDVKEESEEAASVASEVVKEVVHDSAHLSRMNELDAIADQIKALESMVIADDDNVKDGSKEQELDAEEENVTKEFLQLLELEDGDEVTVEMPYFAAQTEEGADSEGKCFVSDLGKGLGSVVQTRDGGYLASMNPFDVAVSRKDTPKLAMQLSKPFILKNQKISSGVEVFQKLAAVGTTDEICAKLAGLSAMDELMGKTAEQIAFEGMASVIISRRSKEGASSSAARSVSELKTMSAAMNDGRKERITTGIWNVKEEAVTVDEILPLALQKIEVMAVEALKIQAEVTEEDAPFDVSPNVKERDFLDNAIVAEEWDCDGDDTVTMMVVVQLRDPLRRYETVGGPAVAIVQAARAGEDGKFKVGSLHFGGLRILSANDRKSGWNYERQRLTAMQWLVAYGLAKGGKKSKSIKEKGGKDVVWSVSARVMADMWLKPIRNPDVKLSEKA